MDFPWFGGLWEGGAMFYLTVNARRASSPFHCSSTEAACHVLAVRRLFLLACCSGEELWKSLVIARPCQRCHLSATSSALPPQPFHFSGGNGWAPSVTLEVPLTWKILRREGLRHCGFGEQIAEGGLSAKGGLLFSEGVATGHREEGKYLHRRKGVLLCTLLHGSEGGRISKLCSCLVARWPDFTVGRMRHMGAEWQRGRSDRQRASHFTRASAGGRVGIRPDWVTTREREKGQQTKSQLLCFCPVLGLSSSEIARDEYCRDPVLRDIAPQFRLVGSQFDYVNLPESARPLAK
eukprot:TRINITY_DN23238_c0_g1_i1.p1 TRINITY_DN23238_c0_g1~~TRINITY_DN23238_c0_g1_i1.p1  ORF type:complete len:293 (+),score=21.59 TRINITY_DN23238_c0_g1_i1:591-1469(+)